MSEWDEIGFVLTPSAMGDRIAALDASIQALDASVRATPFNTRGFNETWRTEWDAFVRRWANERDSHTSWDSRLFSTVVMPIVESYTASYNHWARDFEAKAQRAPMVPKMKPQTDIIPSWAWLAVVGAGVFVLASYRRK